MLGPAQIVRNLSNSCTDVFVAHPPPVADDDRRKLSATRLAHRPRPHEGPAAAPRAPPRELWRVAEPHLADAQYDATIIAIHDQERAGIDIVGDGEMARESYSNRLATALAGIDTENSGTALDRTGASNPVPAR